MASTNCPKSRFSRFMSGHNFIVLALAVVAFWALNRYRQNDPLTAASQAPNFTLGTADNQTFQLYDIHTPVVLVFYSKIQFGGNNVLSKAYEKELPYLRLIQDEGRAQIIILIKGVNTPAKLAEFYGKKNRNYLENISFAYLDSDVAKRYGIRSWPHFFILDANHKILYQTKILTTETIKKQLRSF